MSVTTREKNGPYSTWLGGLLLGFALAWIAIAVVFVRIPSLGDSDVSYDEDIYVFAAFVALVLAACTFVSAALIRWRPEAFPVSTRFPKVALTSVLISGTLASLVACSEAFAGKSDGPDWRLLGCALVVIAAALSAVVLMILRRRFFQASRR